jgi:ribose 5-phosphate isomerase B
MTRGKVAVGSDDVYPAARAALAYLREKGFEVVPIGSLVTEKVEPWPEVAWEVARRVARGEADFGVVVCYTGTGVSMAANKVRGIRAALCNDAKTAEGARRWNDANVLAMSGRLVTEEVAREILEGWLAVPEPDPSERPNIETLKHHDTAPLEPLRQEDSRKVSQTP